MAPLAVEAEPAVAAAAGRWRQQRQWEGDGQASPSAKANETPKGKEVQSFVLLQQIPKLCHEINYESAWFVMFFGLWLIL